MKSNLTFSRHKLVPIIIACYLLPLVGLVSYSNTLVEAHENWDVLSLGLLLSTIGSLILFWIMARWESLWQHHVMIAKVPEHPVIEETLDPSKAPSIDHEHYLAATQAISEAQETISKLQTEKEFLSEKIRQHTLDHDQQHQLVEQTLLESEHFRLSSLHQLEQQQSQILKLQETIAEQKILIEKKHQQMGMLDTKVSDLTYEIKTLLQLAEAHTSTFSADKHEHSISESFSTYHLTPDDTLSTMRPEKQIHTSEEASIQLKRCIDIAQKITGSQHFNSRSNPYLDSPADSFTLDLRRLCDCLRSENASSILLYSPKENQILFANNQIKTITGWSPDKFVQSFNEILQDTTTWRQGITSLSTRSEAQIKLILKTKSGQDLVVQAHLGMIPTGIFRYHTIAVLYTALAEITPSQKNPIWPKVTV